MHVVSFLESDHSEPPGGNLKIRNIGHSSRYDYARCGQQFLRNCSIEFNQIYHDTTIIFEVDARYFISKIGSFRATWWQIENL